MSYTYTMRTSDFVHYYGDPDVAMGSLVNPVNELGFQLSNPQEVLDFNGKPSHYTVEAQSEYFNCTRQMILDLDGTISVQVDPAVYAEMTGQAVRS